MVSGEPFDPRDGHQEDRPSDNPSDQALFSKYPSRIPYQPVHQNPVHFEEEDKSPVEPHGKKEGPGAKAGIREENTEQKKAEEFCIEKG